ncbi:MAG: DUF1990 domain-containing protein [Actinomycetota bacterium]|nr:DUF1990 domain-containing protein [Actinomycetota bacterium]
MFLLNEPSEGEIRRFLSRQSELPFPYDEVGDSRKGLTPPGYATDRYHVKPGSGPEVYARAVEALRGWRRFEHGWARVVPSGAQIEAGVAVCVLARHYGFLSLNPVRIVYSLEESGSFERFGFGYGTLPGHGARGEERFAVEWCREDGSVHYDVFAFSRPNHPLTWPGHPFVRLLQRRFARGSRRSMLVAVGA